MCLVVEANDEKIWHDADLIMGYEVTIGIPVYNAEKYVNRAIDTVLNQSFKEIEVLIVDDYSTDNTVSVIQKFQQTHQRGDCIRLLCQERNYGPGIARNRMIDEAQGRYLYFMDADDTLPVNAISTLYEAVQKYRPEMVYGSYKQIEVYNKYRYSNIYQYPLKIFKRKGSLASYAYRHYGKFQAQVWNVLFDLNFLRKTELRFIHARFWEDMAFTYDLVPYVSRAVLLPFITYNYLCRPNTLSNFQNRDIIQRSEIERNISTIDHIKLGCAELRKKPYIGYRSYDVVMNSFYMVCQLIKVRDHITPSFSDEELRLIMYHPLSMGDIFRSHRKLLGNLMLWSISHLPLRFFMPTIKVLGKLKRAL